MTIRGSFSFRRGCGGFRSFRGGCGFSCFRSFRSGCGGSCRHIEFLARLTDHGDRCADRDLFPFRDEDLQQNTFMFRELFKTGFSCFQREKRLFFLDRIAFFDEPLCQKCALFGNAHLRHQYEISHVQIPFFGL